MNPDNYKPKQLVFLSELEDYKRYLREAGADDDVIQEMTKNIAVVKLEHAD